MVGRLSEIIKKGVSVSSALQKVGGRHNHFIAHLGPIIVLLGFPIFHIESVRHGHFLVSLFIEVFLSPELDPSIVRYKLFGVDAVEQMLQIVAVIGAIPPAVENGHFTELLQSPHGFLVTHISPIEGAVVGTPSNGEQGREEVLV